MESDGHRAYSNILYVRLFKIGQLNFAKYLSKIILFFHQRNVEPYDLTVNIKTYINKSYFWSMLSIT